MFSFLTLSTFPSFLHVVPAPAEEVASASAHSALVFSNSWAGVKAPCREGGVEVWEPSWI